MAKTLLEADVVRTANQNYLFIDLSSHPGNHGRYLPIRFPPHGSTEKQFNPYNTLEIIALHPQTVLRPADLDLRFQGLTWLDERTDLDEQFKIPEMSLLDLLQKGALSPKLVETAARIIKKKQEKALDEAGNYAGPFEELFRPRYEEYYTEVYKDLLSLTFLHLVKMHSERTLDFSLLRHHNFENIYDSTDDPGIKNNLSSSYGPSRVVAKLEGNRLKIANDCTADNHSCLGDYTFLEFEVVENRPLAGELIFPVQRLKLDLKKREEGTGSYRLDQSWNRK